MLGTWDRLSGTGSKVPSALAQELASSQICHSVNTINISYKDTGLFGIYVVGDEADMPAALEVTLRKLHCRQLLKSSRIGTGSHSRPASRHS